jgi:hypothetical protein
MNLETRLVQAHVELYATPKDRHGSRIVCLARYGAYDVRLVEPGDVMPFGAFDFWLELFDHNQRASLDSGGTSDLEQALTIAEELVSHAIDLSKQ